LRRRVKKIVTILSNKKAEDIVVFDLEKSDYFVEHVVLATSMADRHAQSLVVELKNKLKKEGEQFLNIDESDDWVVIDMGDILVHIMSKNKRDMFRIEELLNSLHKAKSQKVEG